MRIGLVHLPPTQYPDSPELASGYCCIGDKAEVYDTEIHAIQEGLLYIISTSWTPIHILVCADNQAALLTLSAGNPNGTEYAQHTLQAVSQLQEMGWSTSGLWTPAHCGMPRNERADALAKLGSQGTIRCQYAKVTKTWLQAQVRQRLLVDWDDQFPPDPLFPIVRSTTFPKDLRKHSPAALRALFRLQSGTTPSNPFPNELEETCPCDGTRTSKHLLLECPILQNAQNDLIPPTIPTTPPGPGQLTPPSAEDVSFDLSHTPALITFLRRPGLGFVRDVCDGLATDDPEVDDLRHPHPRCGADRQHVARPRLLAPSLSSPASPSPVPTGAHPFAPLMPTRALFTIDLLLLPDFSCTSASNLYF